MPIVNCSLCVFIDIFTLFYTIYKLSYFFASINIFTCKLSLRDTIYIGSSSYISIWKYIGKCPLLFHHQISIFEQTHHEESALKNHTPIHFHHLILHISSLSSLRIIYYVFLFYLLNIAANSNASWYS